jgi:Holliday junction resolvasome RuvABC endonuclease subunit
MSVWIGIDPGAISGAWGAIDHNAELIGCGDIQSVNGRVQAKALYESIMGCVSCGDTAMIAVESVFSMPKQGLASTAKFMRAVGSIEATAELTAYQFVLVRPQVWKKYHGLIGTEKVASLELARLMFPEAPLKLKKCHNMADALLMAAWLKDNCE